MTRAFPNRNLITNISLCNIAIVILFCISLIAFYPGQLTLDSISFYKQAITQEYSHHSSPIIPFTWHILNYISKGPFIMLLFEQILLWSSVLVFVDTWYQKYGYSKQIWFFILIPLFPGILKLSGMIWKDVHLAFSYLLAASILIKYTLLPLPNTKIRYFSKILVPIVILYGTAAKYQAIYIAPLFVLWYLMVFYNFSRIINIILMICSFFVLNTSIMELNGYLAKDKKHTSRVGWEEIKFL